MSEPVPITIDIGEARLNFRAAGILIKQDKILLHKRETDNYWTLPGGRIDVLEHSLTSIKREFKEELNVEINVLSLVWSIENFFYYKNLKYHEFGLYYLIECEDIKNFNDIIFVENGKIYTYRWFEIANIEEIPTYPQAITEANLRDFERIKHFAFDFVNLNEPKILTK